MFGFFVAAIILLGLGGGKGSGNTSHGSSSNNNSTGGGSGSTGSGNSNNSGSSTPTTSTVWIDDVKTEEVDLGFDPIPICRPRMIKFSFNGLRPNTNHYFFCDGVDVTDYVTTDAAAVTAFDNAGKGSDYRIPGDKYINETGFPSSLAASSGTLLSTADGELTGLFYLQRNETLQFETGELTLNVIDVSDNSYENSLSYASVIYEAGGVVSYNYTDTYVDGQIQVEGTDAEIDAWEDDGLNPCSEQTPRSIDGNDRYCHRRHHRWWWWCRHPHHWHRYGRYYYAKDRIEDFDGTA